MRTLQSLNRVRKCAYCSKLLEISTLNDAKNTVPLVDFAFFNRNNENIGIDNSNIENIKYDFLLHGYVL